MGEGLRVFNTTAAQINLNYVFVIATFLFLMAKYRNDLFSIYVIVIFYNGLMGYFGKSVQDYYKIGITLFSIFYLVKKDTLRFSNRTNVFIFVFLVFSFFFISTSYFNDDYFSLIFSQYARYFLVFTLGLLFIKYKDDLAFKLQIEKVVFDVLVVQIILSIVKFFIMGPKESLVGSISSQGGATATTLPMLGFVFIWLKRKGEFERKDWLFVIGLVFIGFVGAKRAVWFVMPVLIAAFMFYVPKKKVTGNVLALALMAVPLIFYLGIRLTPTLNKDHKVWGTFDLDYTMEYVEFYSFGDSEGGTAERGRGSAALVVYDKYFNGDLNERDWLGHGLSTIYTTNVEEFSQLGFDISHKGSATGLYETMIANGYLGVMVTLMFGFSLISLTKNKRIFYVLLFVFLWEYCVYTGIILRDYALSFLFVYAIIFSETYDSKVKAPTKNVLIQNA